jgi:hypothetical protein
MMGLEKMINEINLKLKIALYCLKCFQLDPDQATKDWYKYLILVAVVIIFFLSWAPFHLQRLGYVYFKAGSFFIFCV